MKSRIAAAAPAPNNLLLTGLPSGEGQRLMARFEPVDLIFKKVLCEPGERIRHVYFPTASFISLISSVDDGSELEVGLVGAEGMFGCGLLLGIGTGSLRALVQGPGPALRMDAAQFRRQLERSPALKRRLNFYLYVLVEQLAQMATCAHYHFVEARLARWLLMTRDRARSNDFPLTQDFLSHMLGVRRAGINRAASNLQKRRLIRYSRGRMRILDERGLEATSCRCYTSATNAYARVMT